MYEGRPVNKLQNVVILFKFPKNLRYTFGREFNSEYQLWVCL